MLVILACPIQLLRSSPRSHTSIHNRKNPSSSGERGAPTSALIHQLKATTTHMPEAELLAALGRTGGKGRNRDEEEQRKGREEGRFLYRNMGEGQKGQQRNDGRRTKLQLEQRQLMEPPNRAPGWVIANSRSYPACSAKKKELKGEKTRSMAADNAK